MSWLDREIARQRAAEQAARKPLPQPPAERIQITESEIHGRNYLFLQELGVNDLLRDVQREAWRGGEKINYLAPNLLHWGHFDVGTFVGIEFRYQGSRTRRGKIVGDDAPAWTDGSHPIYEQEAISVPVRDGIYIGILTKGQDGNIDTDDLVVRTVKSGFNDSVIFSRNPRDVRDYSDGTHAYERISDLLHMRNIHVGSFSDKQTLRRKIQEALAADVLQRQQEGRFPATLPTRYGPPPKRRWGGRR